MAFLVVFLGAKAGALFGILWLASVAEPRVFGAVEFALAASLLVAALGTLGFPGTVTNLALVKDQPKIEDLLSFVGVAVSAPATAAALFGLASGWPPIRVLVLAACAPAVGQIVVATYARIRGKPMLNAVVDPAATLAFIVLGGVLWAVGGLSVALLSRTLTALAVLVTGALILWFIRTRRDRFLPVFGATARLAVPILCLSGVSMLVGVALRPLLGLRFSLEALAAYSLCFRLCAPLMLVHQGVATAFFARLYKAATPTFDRVAASLVGVLLLLTLGMTILLPWIVEVAFPQYSSRLPELVRLFPIVGLQVILWVVNALLEMQAAQHDIALRVAGVGYALFAVFTAAVVVSPAWLSVLLVTAMFNVFLGALAGAQIALLWRRDVRLVQTAAAMIVASGLIAGAAMLLR